MKKLIGTAAAALLVASPAMAVEAREYLRNPEVFAGIGFGSFTQNLGDVTGAAFAWGARVGVSPWRNLGAELNYQALHSGVETIIAPGIAAPIQDKNYNQNQITANARVNVPVEVQNRELVPYGLAGIGYARLSGDAGLSTIGIDDDNAVAIPLGVGALYQVTNVFAVDARFTYNILAAANAGPVGGSADSWDFGINVGARWGGAPGSAGD